MPGVRSPSARRSDDHGRRRHQAQHGPADRAAAAHGPEPRAHELDREEDAEQRRQPGDADERAAPARRGIEERRRPVEQLAGRGGAA